MNHFKKFILVGLVSPILWIGCADQSKQSSKTAAITDGSIVGDALMGAGWDTHSESFKGYCVENEGSILYAGSPTSELYFDRTMSIEELETALDVQVSGKLKMPIFTVQGAAKFVSEAASNNYSSTLIFSHIIKGKSAIMRNSRLSTTGLDVASGAEGADFIRLNCGDEYVSKIHLGAQIFVGVKFEFSSREAKSEFEANIDFDYMDLFSVSGAAGTALDQFKHNVTIKLFALQQGGDPQRLSEILNSTSNELNTENEPRASFVSCDINRRDACLDAMNNIVSYISSDSPHSFKNQIAEFVYDPTKPGGPAFLKYETTSYYAGGHSSLYPTQGALLSSAIKDARLDLISKYEETRDYLNQANNLLKMYLSEEERQNILTANTSLEKNKQKILDTAKICYGTPRNCLDTYSQMTLEKIDPKLLSHVNNFFDYCVADGFGQHVKETVLAIRKKLDLQNVSCKYLYTELLSYRTLNLDNSDPKIIDLKPLRGLEHLISLDLNDNKITNIDPLSGFKKLTSLSLRNNNIQNIDMINELEKLNTLDVAYNNIIDVDVLRDNHSLRKLYIFENHASLNVDPIITNENIVDVIYSKKSWCDARIDKAYGLGVITAADAELYKEIGFAPKFKYEEDFQSGVDSWFQCEIVFDESGI